MADHSTLIPKATLDALIATWLKEDIPSFDWGGFVVGDDVKTAKLLGKSPGILAGVPFVNSVFEATGATIEWHIKEGTVFEPITHIATVTGPARAILAGERIALNTLARASGIAKRGLEFSALAKEAGWHGVIAATRKTTPGFRLVEKYAQLIGGVDTHRMDLSSMCMIKDNHIWAKGSITAAVKAARAVGGFSVMIDVECQNFDEAKEAFTAGANICMLDNHTPEQIVPSAQKLKELFPWGKIEASGGITPDNIKGYFHPSVDVISCGSLTQGVGFVDYSLKIQK